VPAVNSSPGQLTQRQSLGLVDRACTGSEMLQYFIEGEAAREELDLQARQLYLLAEQFTEAARLSEAASQHKSEFVAMVSHEMRTPLNGIIGMTDVLLSKNLPESARDCIEVIRQSGDALLAIVGDVLDFSKIEAGQMRIERGDFEIAAVLDQSTQIVRNAATRKFLTLKTYLDPAIPAVVVGDVVRVRQILLNLLSNAIKFSFEGEIELRAELRSTTQESLEIYFSVKDNGIGITPAQQTRLFQPFSQADDSITKRFGGSGLGLAISKRLAELMGGAIGVTSSQKAGSQASASQVSGSLFWFTIWAERSKAVSRSQVTPAAKQPAPVQGQKTFRVLLVEDNSVNQKVAMLLLAKLGYEADLAQNGAQALSAVTAAEYDLILMDCHMPEMDGFEATRRLRSATGYTAHVPVIALTASAFPQDRQACLAAGMSDFLSKPVRQVELASKLEHWLATSSSSPPLQLLP